MNTIALRRFTCPSCSTPMEIEALTPGQGVRCPGCDLGFVPFPGEAPRPQIIPGEGKAKARHQSGSEARLLQAAVGLFFFGISIMLLGLGIFLAAAAIGSLSSPMLLAVAALLTWGAILIFLSQLFHIRAALERLASEK